MFENKNFSVKKVSKIKIPKSENFFMFLFLFALTIYSTPLLSNKYAWKLCNSPVYYDLKCVRFFNKNFGVTGCKKVFIFRNGEWKPAKKQPPVKIDLIDVIDTNTYFVSVANKMQESDFYRGGHGKWEKINIPFVNYIVSMKFLDSINGVIAGLGEIAVMKNGKWKVLVPPSNEMFISCTITADSNIYVIDDKGKLFKYEKNKWKSLLTDTMVKKIKNFSNGGLYLLGYNSLLKIENNGKIRKLLNNDKLSTVNDFFVLNDSLVFFAADDGHIFKFTNGIFIDEKTPTKENINSIWMFNDKEGWAVGDDGVMLHYSDSKKQSLKTQWQGFKKIFLNDNAKVIDDEYGVAVADYNNDGMIDVFVAGLFEPNHLYINKGNNIFHDNAQSWGISGDKSINIEELNLGACAGDFNNDGYMDIYVSGLNRKNKIFLNQNGKYFMEYSKFSGGVGNENDRTNGVITGDVDNDGDLDIFIANEFSTNRLYLNNGAGIFTEADSVGLKTDGGGMGCSFADIDNDGDIDLFVTNWSKKNRLYKNMLVENGKLFFKDITGKAGVGGVAYTKSNAVVFSDIDNDADLDLFVTNRKYSNRLYLNNGDCTFKDVTKEYMGLDSLKSYGAVIADFDGDDFKDIYINNVGKNTFYKNINGKKFVDETEKYGLGIKGYNTGNAIGDFDGDGELDIYVANFYGESSCLLINSGKGNNSIFFKVKGYKNNINAIGSKIYVYDTNERLICFEEVNSGEGYASMNQNFYPIGTGKRKKVNVKFIFPDGTQKYFTNVKAGTTLDIEDVSPSEKIYYSSIRLLTGTFLDKLSFLKFLKLSFILVFLFFSMRRGYRRYSWSLFFVVVFSIFLLGIVYIQSMNFEHKNLKLYFTLPILTLVLLTVIVHLFYESVYVANLSMREQEKIREKLSRDLHDDLASTISTISIYLTLIKYNLKEKDNKVNDLLDKTSALAEDASDSITDLIWAIKPQPESVYSLINRINNNFYPLFREKGIEFILKVGKQAGKTILSTQYKKDLYLIIKEALNNILKYSKASRVEIIIKKAKKGLWVEIKDNGIGFEYEKVKDKGHGLSNMKVRVMGISLWYKLNSEPGKGTKINFLMKIPKIK